VWRHTWRKMWVNSEVLKGNGLDLRTVLFFLSFTQRIAQLTRGVPVSSVYLLTPRCHHLKTSVSSNLFSRWALHDIFLFKYHLLLQTLRFLFFCSDNIMDDVASKQQTTALFLSTIDTLTRRHTQLTKKLTNLMGKLLRQRAFSSVFVADFYFAQLNCTL
jgi:hypothetical protein